MFYLNNATQIDRRGNDHQVAGCGIDRLFQILDLVFAVAHRRKQHTDLGIFGIGISDRSHGVGARIDQFGRAKPFGSNHAGAVSHLAVGQCGAIFYDEHTFASDRAVGFQVLRAAELVQQGASRHDIVAALQLMRDHIQIVLVPDTLENLYRGGRISAARAWVGTLLKVKPLLSFSKGYIEPIQQVRTTRRAEARMLELMTNYLGNDQHPWISVMHSRSLERGRYLLDQLLLRFPDARFFFSEIGPVLGVHLGIGGTGLIVCRSNGLGITD